MKIFAKDSAKALMRDLDRKFADYNKVGEYEDLIDNLRVDIPVCDGNEIIAGDMTNKGLISKSSHYSITKKQTTQLKNGQNI